MNHVELTAGIVAAYVANNAVTAGSLPALIETVHRSVGALADRPSSEPRPVPPVPVKKTIHDDHLVSLEDGRRYKSLKRHLAGRGLTPEQYRRKWGLPPDYPMVAASYARQRAELAKAMGLGRTPKG